MQPYLTLVSQLQLVCMFPIIHIKENPRNAKIGFALQLQIAQKLSVAAILRWRSTINHRQSGKALQARGSAQSGSGIYCVRTQLYSAERQHDAQTDKVFAPVLFTHHKSLVKNRSRVVLHISWSAFASLFWPLWQVLSHGYDED